jgi:DNA-binding NarL/FixJ family response regulator
MFDRLIRTTSQQHLRGDHVHRTVIIADTRHRQKAARDLLSGSELTVVATTASEGDLEPALAVWRPDLVLIDLAGCVGMVGVLDAVCVARPAADAVVLVEEHDGRHVVPAFQHGARGLLARHRTTEELLEALRTVVSGGTVVDPALALPLALSVTRGTRVTGPYGLSRREELVLAHLADELSNGQIGQRIGISSSTVRTHLRHAFQKLGINDRSEVAHFAVERGLV